MSSSWGTHLKLSIFGESHGGGIGAVLDGLPAGECIDMEELFRFLARRAPGKDRTSTPRREADRPEILSGIQGGVTCGTPVGILIHNTDTRSGDYGAMQTLARPGHADYTGFLRYGGQNDVRGGGHFSGRLTAPLAAAGGIAKQILAHRGITVGAHLLRAGGIDDIPFDPVEIDEETLLTPGNRPFPVLDAEAGDAMRAEIERARLDLDSVGGVVECAAVGFPAGVGDPMFGGVENVLASILFGIPACKGVEFGAGFASSDLRGSENNDPFYMKEGKVRTETNRHGGALGGISSGMPILVRAAFKPTPSIAREQRTVDYRTNTEAVLAIKGRHDPCLAVRAVPCVEAAVALALLDLLLGAPGAPSGKGADISWN